MQIRQTQITPQTRIRTGVNSRVPKIRYNRSYLRANGTAPIIEDIILNSNNPMDKATGLRSIGVQISRTLAQTNPYQKLDFRSIERGAPRTDRKTAIPSDLKHSQHWHLFKRLDRPHFELVVVDEKEFGTGGVSFSIFGGLEFVKQVHLEHDGQTLEAGMYRLVLNKIGIEKGDVKPKDVLTVVISEVSSAQIMVEIYQEDNPVSLVFGAFQMSDPTDFGEFEDFKRR